MAVWLLVTVTGLGVLLMVEAWRSAHRASQQAFDSQLESAALTIAEAVQWEESEPVMEVPAAALQILATQQQERVFYAMLTTDGEPVSANMPFTIMPAWRAQVANEPLAVTTTFDDTSWRLYGREYDSAGWITHEPVQIWVGHTRKGRKALAGELFERSVGHFVAMVLLAGVLMILTMRVALAPMRRLRHLLRRREADDMRPLDTRVPEEMRELADTLDHLFARQRQSRESLLRFTADASHQLKTPLAGLQSTSELALQSADPAQWHTALVTMHDSAERTSRLASQLLSLARLRHTGESEAVELVDLNSVLRETLLDWAGRQVASQHDLGLAELPPEPLWVRADAWAIREVLGNLIDNALRYTPPGSQITVGVKRQGDEALMFVEDNGPGVTYEACHQLLRPFERGGRQGTDGSGLGLAIVDSIAQHFGARLLLETLEPHGLMVKLYLPLYPPPYQPRHENEQAP
nr:sensor histidine kinase [Halomonas salicampi]